MSLSLSERCRKFRVVTAFMGADTPAELIARYRNQALVPGICTGEFCDGISYVGCDEEAGWCWDCDEETIQSILIFAGLQ